ncbi:hypothetical protein BXZ70DRAFT_890718 [Cristinia sonorae]|uniref:FAD-binding domain-containing protein n=1 Tax=Cristinia sonorae TaxID=1940300 RepID=A0A8K0UQD4_9AGAR|nr:hypothetical protein BXZ70DRAFT_890718 [Cristinia sonorae]
MPKAPLTLSFIIVGGGIGGLSAAVQLARSGHTVTVLEGNKATEDTGAGINVPPNAARILINLGLCELLDKFGVYPKAIVYRRYKNGQELARHDASQMKAKHGASYYNIHRGELAAGLIDLIRGFDTTDIRFDAGVVSVNPPENEDSKPSVTLKDGLTLVADLIIGADGIRSITRPVVTGSNDRPTDTGDVAFRSLIPTEKMLEDPDLASLVTEQEVNVWLGPGRHIVSYNISDKKQYHLAIARPGDPSLYVNESWIVTADPDVMRAGFEDWEPRVVKLLNLVDVANKRKLVDRPPNLTWVHSSKRILLLGDACHPMLPYRAQGAAMAMEDAAALGVLFSYVSSPTDINDFVLAYQEQRAARCGEAQMASQQNRDEFHLPDGEAQRARDAKYAHGNPIAVEKGNRNAFDHDAAEIARAWLRGRGVDVCIAQQSRSV